MEYVKAGEAPCKIISTRTLFLTRQRQSSGRQIVKTYFDNVQIQTQIKKNNNRDNKFQPQITRSTVLFV